MIKKLTPSKNFNQSSQVINCCTSLFTLQRNQEKVFNIAPKIYPQKSHNVTFKFPEKKEEDTFFTPQTPKISHFNTRANSINKNPQICTVTTFKNPTKIRLQREENGIVKLNPLQRLKLRYSASTSSQSHTQQQAPIKHDKISFNYSSPMQSCFHQSSKTYQNHETFDLKHMQHSLQREIQDFQQEYKQLLLEFERLKNQKSSNKQYFQMLLLQIQKKEQQILKLQSLRKEQIRQLKRQLQSFLQQQKY